jgi:hypothetical protein
LSAPAPPPDSGESEPSANRPDQKDGESDSPSPWAEKQRLIPLGAVEFLTLGLTWAVLLVGGGLLGSLVDGWLGTSPAFVLVGLALGIAVGVRMTVTRVRKYL